MISRCSFKISNVQIHDIQCSPFVDTVTAGHWGGAGRRPWETENLLRARQLVPHLTHNALPLFLVAARAAWQSLTAWCWRPSRKIAPPLWPLELQSPPSRSYHWIFLFFSQPLLERDVKTVNRTTSCTCHLGNTCDFLYPKYIHGGLILLQQTLSIITLLHHYKTHSDSVNQKLGQLR